MKIHHTYGHGHDSPRPDNEWHNVLLECLNHPIDEHLTDKGVNCHEQHVFEVLGVGKAKQGRVLYVQGHDLVEKGHQGCVLIDDAEHLDGGGFVQVFNFGIKIWYKTVCKKTD